ncbi:hypothetical protein RE9416_45620 [Prescottella equi]|nr:hypothetical protein RE9416_45620 [Prescottella equi]
MLGSREITKSPSTLPHGLPNVCSNCVLVGVALDLLAAIERLDPQPLAEAPIECLPGLDPANDREGRGKTPGSVLGSDARR